MGAAEVLVGAGLFQGEEDVADLARAQLGAARDPQGGDREVVTDGRLLLVPDHESHTISHPESEGGIGPVERIIAHAQVDGLETRRVSPGALCLECKDADSDRRHKKRRDQDAPQPPDVRHAASMTEAAHARERAPNRLAREQSPYLLQHQWNPVDWYPWGPEAFEKARNESRPVFLSIGYSSCHWCHVMEHESFESESIARLLNEKFVSIKVDREERPDVDEIYMRAVQLLTGSGGWPMSVFLTPDQKPFWGGTYFPPDDREGRPGFASILGALAETWSGKRAEVESAADRLASALRQMEGGRQFVATGPLGPEITERALEELSQTYDRHHGGFGGAPKFPPHGALELLLHATTPKGSRPDLEAIARGTLDGMALGGIRDQIGGGFHRYSTDAIWLLPHFEKMLYDNAQLAPVYAEAFARWGEIEYRRAAEDALEWTRREMTSPEGAFYSALDADSEGGEGAYYLWSRDEILDALGAEEGDLFSRVYGIEEGGNFTD